MHKISFINSKPCVITAEFNASASSLQTQFIMYRHRLNEGFQFMEAIIAAAEDIE